MSIKVEGDEVVIRLSLDEWGDLRVSLGTIKGRLELKDRRYKEEDRALFGYRDCIKEVDQCVDILSNKEEKTAKSKEEDLYPISFDALHPGRREWNQRNNRRMTRALYAETNKDIK